MKKSTKLIVTIITAVAIMSVIIFHVLNNGVAPSLIQPGVVFETAIQAKDEDEKLGGNTLKATPVAPTISADKTGGKIKAGDSIRVTATTTSGYIKNIYYYFNRI